ncbi:MAG: adenylate/guanylate cyclase domain-containing protein [Terriglobia bacterium]|jgi:adenylate cyclase
MSGLINRALPWTFQFVRRHRAGLAISVGVCVVSLGLYVPLYFVPHHAAILDLLYDMELKSLDARFRLRGQRPPNPAIAIVTIDQKSQDELGRWPFPRDNFATLVDVLKDAGAKVITFDAAFPQPDQNSALKLAQQLQKAYDLVPSKDDAFAAKLQASEAHADNDRKFADALSRFDNAILGYFLFFTEEEVNQASRQNKTLLDDFKNVLSFQAYPQVIHPEYGYKFNCFYCAAKGIEPNLPALAQNAKNFGFFNVVADPDAVVRREPVVIRFENSYYPSLDVATVLAYTNRPLDQVAVFFNPNGLERIDFGPFAIPTDPDGYVQIDFHGPRRTYPWYSMTDVVHGRINPGNLRGKIVLVGPTATAIADNRSTPFETGENFPGVEIHANFIDNLLTGEFIRRGLRENLIDVGFLLLFSLGAGLPLSVVSAKRATPVVVILLALFLWLAYYLFAAHRIWIAAFLPTATLSMNYAAIVSYRFFFEEREKRKVRGAFSQYVAPGVVARLLDHPEFLRLGGEEKELTAMFTDIRGFTALSEGLSPEALVVLLNEYLSEMTEVIFRNWGTLDKYIGDAIMAFWGSPFPQTDHAERACRAALEMLETLKKLQARWQAQGRAQINIGVGINTGPMVVGNMGSKNRFNFTIMGDNVNLASRLEGTNKEFGTRSIISESTYQAANHIVVARELDLIRVKGKLKPVRIYELLGHAHQQDEFRDLLERFHNGLECYRGGAWDLAAELFDGLVQDYPNDKPSQVFLDRCRHLIGEPPEGVWDGVYVMTHK